MQQQVRTGSLTQVPRRNGVTTHTNPHTAHVSNHMRQSAPTDALHQFYISPSNSSEVFVPVPEITLPSANKDVVAHSGCGPISAAVFILD